MLALLVKLDYPIQLAWAVVLWSVGGGEGARPNAHDQERASLHSTQNCGKSVHGHLLVRARLLLSPFLFGSSSSSFVGAAPPFVGAAPPGLSATVGAPGRPSTLPLGRAASRFDR